MSTEELIDVCDQVAQITGWNAVADNLIAWAEHCLYAEIAKGLQDMAATEAAGA